MSLTIDLNMSRREKQISRTEIFKILEEERDFQDKMRPSTHHEGNASIPAHLLLIQEYLHRAISSWTNYRGMAEVEALDELRKVAALAIRCMEQNGAVRRENCPEVPKEDDK